MLRPTAIKVQAIDNYKLLIEFDNGETRIFDATILFERKAYQQIKCQEVFKQVKTNNISIVWLSDIDVCPDELYYNSVPIED
jgi:hypothetical protein